MPAIWQYDMIAPRASLQSIPCFEGKCCSHHAMFGESSIIRPSLV